MATGIIRYATCHVPSKHAAAALEEHTSAAAPHQKAWKAVCSCSGGVRCHRQRHVPTSAVHHSSTLSTITHPRTALAGPRSSAAHPSPTAPRQTLHAPPGGRRGSGRAQVCRETGARVKKSVTAKRQRKIGNSRPAESEVWGGEEGRRPGPAEAVILHLHGVWVQSTVAMPDACFASRQEGPRAGQACQ